MLFLKHQQISAWRKWLQRNNNNKQLLDMCCVQPVVSTLCDSLGTACMKVQRWEDRAPCGYGCLVTWLVFEPKPVLNLLMHPSHGRSSKPTKTSQQENKVLYAFNINSDSIRCYYRKGVSRHIEEIAVLEACHPKMIVSILLLFKSVKWLESFYRLKQDTISLLLGYYC